MSFCSRGIRRVLVTLLVLMTISSLVIAPVHATEEPLDYGQFYGVVQVPTLNVRTSASMDSEIVTQLTQGAVVRVNWTEPGWVCIAYNNDGLMGYVSDEFISVKAGEMPEFDSTQGQAVVDLAATFLGLPYIYGGTTPRGFDCSGLVQYVYGQLGYSVNRIAHDQMKNGIYVSREQLQPGDIVGFYSSPGSGYVGHVGLYAGDGMMIHSPHTGDVVKYTSIDGSYYASRFAGGRRIIY